MLLFTCVPLQLNGDDCRVGKQQQDIHSVRARSTGATGRWRTKALPRYTLNVWWRANGGVSFTPRRPASTPPYLWTTRPAPPLRYRTVQISWACCSAFRHAGRPEWRRMVAPTADVDPNWLVPDATPTRANHRERFEGQTRCWHGLDCLSGGDRTMSRRFQGHSFLFFLNGLLSPLRGSGMGFPFQIH